MGSPARRCSTCGLDWPDEWGKYRKCPQCLDSTDRIGDGDPMESDEARSLKNHLDFDRYFERWDEDRRKREEEQRKRELEALDAAASAPEPA